MFILKKCINDNRKYTNRDLALAIGLSTTAGILTGIAVNSNSEKISKIIKKLKNKSTDYIEEGKNQAEDLLKQMEDLLKQKK